jgi:hypothetical protein
LLLVFIVPLITRADANYGYGAYGACSYGVACPTSTTLTITSSSSVSLNVTFSGGSNACAIGSDNVTVTTDNSTGYKLYLMGLNSSGYLTGATNISSTTATETTATGLANNTWGYRIDDTTSLGTNFGSGPTTSSTNPSSANFAQVPYPWTNTTAVTSMDLIESPTTAQSGGKITPVWYGICVDTSIPSGSYTNTIIYTAVTNP